LILGSNTVLWTVTDGSGNISTCTQQVEVEDNELPMITCPSDVTVDTDPNVCTYATNQLILATGTDNCSVSSIDFDLSELILGSNTVLWTVTDGSGNISTCAQQVEVEDNELPMITCPSDVTVDTDPNVCTYATNQLTSATGTDNCSVSSIAFDLSELILGSNVVEWTISDGSGNISTCAQQVEVEDNELPEITCPSDITVDTDPSVCAYATSQLTPAMGMDNCSMLSIDFDLSELVLGPNTVIWIATDGSDNTTICAQQVEVEDNELPVITCPSDITVSTDSDVCTYATSQLVPATGTDNCSVFSIDIDLMELVLGSNKVIWTVTDNSGNTSTCAQQVEIEDNELPTITCQADVTVDSDDSLCTFATNQLVSATAVDNCDVNVEVTFSPDSLGLGSNIVIWTATDDSGNTVTCSQQVEVEDNEFPEITCPSDITVNTDANVCTYATSQLTPAIGSDNCSVSNIDYDLSELLLGSNTVLWTVTDGSGNTVSCSQSVFVQDEMDPTIVCPANIIVETDSLECYASGIDLGTPIIDDNCIVTDTTNNALINYPSGLTSVVWIVTDNSGNTNSCEQTVQVIDNELPIITCPDDRVVDTDSGLCTAEGFSFGVAGATDNCAIQTISNNSVQPFAFGITDVTWTITDASGNSATCIQTIEVEDNEFPEIICPSDLTVETDVSICSASNVDLGSEIATDNCGIQMIDNDALNNYPLDLTIVTWTVIDLSGNSTTCTQSVLVIDIENPTIECPSDVTVDTDILTCVSTNVDLGNSLDFDNCSIASVVNNAQAIYDLGVSQVTWIITDGSGNTNSCLQIVNVVDNELPTITCPNAVVVDTDVNLCQVNAIALGSPNTTDNCGVQTIMNDLSLPLLEGDTVIVWTVIDDSGNSTTCAQNVTVEDNELPAILCPADMTFSTDDDLCITTNFDIGNVVSSDNCEVTLIENDALSEYTVGTYTITWTVTDSNDNTASCEQSISIEDNEDPIITCPSDLTVDTDLGICSASGVVIGDPITTDNCGVNTIENDASEPYELGTNIITWMVVDLNGLSSTCQQSIEIEDNELPAITCPSDLTVDTDIGICTASGVDLGAESTSDNCSISWVSNNGTPEYVLGENIVEWLVIDGSGNTAACTQIVIVEDIEFPTISCPIDLTFDTQVSDCYRSGVDIGSPNTTDNCSVNNITNSSIDTFFLGLTTIEWTVEDGSGNTSVCSQNITVEDNELPTISCPIDVSFDVNFEMCTANNVDIGSPIVTDNCSIDTVFNNSSQPFEVGDTIIYWTVIDGSGNSASCSQTITVLECIMAIDDCYETIENESIDIDILLNDIQVTNGGSIQFTNLVNGNVLTTDVNNTPDDYTDDIFTYVPNPGFRGEDTFTYTITDASGNSSTATVKVTVLYYDMAIRKLELPSGPYSYGQNVTFQIELINQGLLDVVDVEINDYLPCGLKFLPEENPRWTFDPITEFANTIYNDTIRARSSVFLDITLEVSACNFPNAWKNGVEIFKFSDSNGNDATFRDSDSRADDLPFNDNVIDNETELGFEDDDDDHDIAEIEVFDLALIKMIETLPLYNVGDNLQFDMIVVNQGNVPASNVVVTDHLPYGFDFNEDPVFTEWVYIEDRSYNYTIEQTILPGDSVIVTMNTVLVLQELLDVYYTNIAEISFATDTEDLERIDADSSPDFDPFNEGANIVDNAFNDDNDEDDHDIEGIDLVEDFIYPCEDDCDVFCQGLVNVSLDENCMACITPAMVGLGIHERCNDYYTVTVYDEYGVEVPGAKVNFSHIGQNMTFKITEPLCENSCWGNLWVEYKLPPLIDCPEDLTVSCFALNQLPMPLAVSSCSTAEVVLHNEFTDRLDCDDDYTHLVTRTFRAFDEFGNESFCVQNIKVERMDLTNITFPASLTVVNDNQLICGNGSYEFDEDNMPLPWPSDTIYSGTGVPIYCDSAIENGLVCPMTTDSTGVALIPGVDQICNGVVIYTDVEVPITDCVRRIIRTWEVREWWCSGETSNGSIQIIEIQDTIAPEFICPSDFTVSTTDDCSSLVQMDSIVAHDLCNNGINVSIDYPNGLLHTNGGLIELETGINEVIYIVNDDCYNRSSCTINVTVVDQLEPVNICEQDMIVALSSSEILEIDAIRFDDGSWDDCGISKFEVRRMDSLCVASDTLFSESVHFCCGDIYNEVMVALRVYDTSGNFNDCMVTVNVTGNNNVNIMCPVDRIISCTMPYDTANLSLIFDSPEFEGNCLAISDIEEIVTLDVDQCGVGSILRTFRPSVDTTVIYCKQIITIENETPLTFDQITWPEDYTTDESCGLNLDPADLPEINAFPSYPDSIDNCDLIGWDHDDVIVQSTGEVGTCFIIERTWTVINWCSKDSGSFETFQIPTPQLIRFQNFETPVLDTIENLVFESIDINCDSVAVDIERIIVDDCPLGSNVTYKVFDKNNIIYAAGDTSRYLDTLANGNYSIEWIVGDGCGNTVVDTQFVSVTNVKSPTPVCLNMIIVSLDDVDFNNDGTVDDAQVDIWASDIDAGSYHSCGNDIVLSFDPDTTITNLLYNCDNVGGNMVQLWVTDRTTGIQDFCTSIIEVLPTDFCNAQNMAQIGGDIYTENGEMVEGVDVNLQGESRNDVTEEDGNYAFDDVTMYNDYTIIPHKDDDHLNGVSTLDLVLIQRHILGLAKITSPYKLIAADINNDGFVTAIDLVELRKLIIDVKSDFTDNTSWRFIDAEYQFPDVSNPSAQPIPELYEIFDLTNDMDVDFIGVKIGDVNGSVIANAIANKIEDRNRSRSLDLILPQLDIRKGDIVTLPVTASNYYEILGWQGSLHFDKNAIDVLDIIPNELELIENINYNLDSNDNGYINFSSNVGSGISIDEDDILFEIVVRANDNVNTSNLFAFNSTFTKQEAYNTFNETLDLVIKTKNLRPAKIENVYPNPWIDNTKVEFYLPEGENVQFEFYDAKGSLVYSLENDYPSGNHMFTLDRELFLRPGVIYIKMITSKSVDQYKMLIVK